MCQPFLSQWFGGGVPQLNAPLLSVPACGRSYRATNDGAPTALPPNQNLSAPEKTCPNCGSLCVYRVRVQQFLSLGITSYQGFPQSQHYGELLTTLIEDATRYVGLTSGADTTALNGLVTAVRDVSNRRRWVSGAKSGWNSFSETDVVSTADAIEAALTLLPPATQPSHQGEDAPIPFDVRLLPDHLEHLARENGTGQQNVQFIANLVLRVRGMLSDTRLEPILSPTVNPTAPEWLDLVIGGDQPDSSNISILDLSLVPSDVLHLIIAVIARLVFETLQRYRKLTHDELPTVMVLEEAHAFVSRGSDVEENVATPAQMCRQTFERIAREGRKFGLGLVLSSQRPSELSPTVLAQCNTFLLHRIVNDRDQELIGRLVPDDLRGLLKELPSLPTRLAVLLGWATPVPILVELKELLESERTRSADPRFWETWSRRIERPADWNAIVADWTE